jgi:hypothetical protein
MLLGHRWLGTALLFPAATRLRLLLGYALPAEDVDPAVASDGGGIGQGARQPASSSATRSSTSAGTARTAALSPAGVRPPAT